MKSLVEVKEITTGYVVVEGDSPADIEDAARELYAAKHPSVMIGPTWLEFRGQFLG